MSFDLHYNSVSLLLHCDGANDSTTFVDSSPAPKTVTAIGNARISTAQSKFGGASLDTTNPGGSYGSSATPSNTTSLIFGTGDFTVEFFIRTYLALQGNNYPRVMAVGNYLTHGGWNLVYLKPSSGLLHLDFYANGGTALGLPCGTLVDNTWHHVAFTRSDTTVRTFLDGAQQGSGTSGLDLSATNPFTISAESSQTGLFRAFFDEIRITKGVARYTSNFTPPATPFPDAAPPPAPQAHIAVATPLGAVQALAETIAPAFAYAAAPSPLSTAQAKAFFGQSFFVRASAPTVLGSTQAQAQVVTVARAAGASPLGAVSAVAGAWPLVQAYAAAPSLLGNASAVAMITPMAYASAPSPLGAVSAFAMATVSAYASAPTPLGEPAVRADVDISFTHTLGAVTQFGAPKVMTICRATEGIQLIPFIPSLIAYQDSVFTTVAAQQEQPIPAPVFGTPSVRFATSHPAASLDANPTFGVPVVRVVHEATSLDPVVFGSGDMPTFSASASSLFGQVEFGVPVVRTVHSSGNWDAGIRIGTLAAVTTGSFPVLGSIESTQFGAPYLGATIHRAMPLYAMPQFGPITISRSHAC